MGMDSTPVSDTVANRESSVAWFYEGRDTNRKSFINGN